MPTLISGSYTTVDSNPVILKLPFIPSFFEVWVQGNSAGNVWTSTNGAIKRAVYQQTMPAGSALCQAGSATGDISTYLSSNGITPITALPYLGPVVAGTGVTSANPGVITITPNNAFSSGSLVQFPTDTHVLSFLASIASILVELIITLSEICMSAIICPLIYLLVF